jgi:phosphoribosylglycinamide formyltransferase 1
MAGRRTAVLISGSGSNLQALIDACEAGGCAAEIVLVISNRAAAFGLERARRHGIGAVSVDHRGFASREAFEAELDGVLRRAEIELVCLAGFMRVLTPGFVEAWRDRLLNIHPSLLPSFPGLDTHARALRAGCRVHGCTVHLVRPTLDSGPILVQGVVPVLACDDAASLAARVLEVEHRCYPVALDLVARDAVRIAGDRVTLPRDARPLVLHPELAGHAFQP